MSNFNVFWGLIAHYPIDPSVGVYLNHGPGVNLCGASDSYRTGIFFECNYDDVLPRYVGGYFNAVCLVEYTISTNQACPCRNLHYGSQYGGDCTCASIAPFGYWKSVCGNATWNLRPFNSSLPAVFQFNGQLNNLVSDRVYINGSYIQSSGSTLAMSVFLSDSGSSTGAAMEITGCVTLGGTLEVTFMNGSAFVSNARIPLLQFACRTNNSQFAQVRVLNTPTTDSSSLLFVYSTNLLELALQGATPISLSSTNRTASNVTSTGEPAPLRVVFVNNTPQAQMSTENNQGGQSINDGTSQKLQLQFVSIAECTPSNSHFSFQWIEKNETRVWFPQSTSDYGISLSNLVLAGQQVQEVSFSTRLSNNATVWIKYLLASSGAAFTAPFADTMVAVGDNALKFSFDLADWPASSFDQTTKLCLQLDIVNNPSASAVQLDNNDGNQTVYSLLRNANSPSSKQAEISLLNFATISSSSLDCGSQTISASSNNTITKEEVQFRWTKDAKGLMLVFPMLGEGRGCLSYDPSVALFLSAPDQSGGDGTTTLLLAILIPVCGGVAVLAFVTAVVGGIVLAFKKTIRKRSWTRGAMVNFVPASEENELS